MRILIGVLAVTVILLATLGCCPLVIDGGLTYPLETETIEFTEQSERLTIYRFLDFPEGQGNLCVYGFGHRNPDSDYVLAVKIESRDMTDDEHLLFVPDKVRAWVGDTELEMPPHLQRDV